MIRYVNVSVAYRKSHGYTESKFNIHTNLVLIGWKEIATKFRICYDFSCFFLYCHVYIRRIILIKKLTTDFDGREYVNEFVGFFSFFLHLIFHYLMFRFWEHDNQSMCSRYFLFSSSVSIEICNISFNLSVNCVMTKENRTPFARYCCTVCHRKSKMERSFSSLQSLRT